MFAVITRRSQCCFSSVGVYGFVVVRLLLDIYWANTGAKIVFVLSGHARLCDLSAHQIFATTKKCGICRQEIDLLLPILVN